MPSRELIAGDETFAVEFKSTARWNIREAATDKRMEDAVVKTIAGFLNTDGGTLIVGVDDRRTPIGLGHDVRLVQPPNVDGHVNWLTTHLIAALTNPGVMRTRTRIELLDGVDICRVDVAPSSRPVMATMSATARNLGPHEQQHACPARAGNRRLLSRPLVSHPLKDGYARIPDAGLPVDGGFDGEAAPLTIAWVGYRPAAASPAAKIRWSAAPSASP